MEAAVMRPADVVVAVEYTAPEEADLLAKLSEEMKKKHTRASSSDSDEMYSGILSKGGKAIHTSEDIVMSSVKNGAEVISYQLLNKTLILDGNNNGLPPSVMSFEAKQHVETTAFSSLPKGMEQTGELDLNSLYTLPDNNHNFYCPSCNSCVTKVIILRDDPRLKSLPPSPPPSFEAVGPSLAFRRLPAEEGDGGGKSPMAEPPRTVAAVGPSLAIRPQPAEEDGGERILCSNCFSFLIPIGDWISSQIGIGRKRPVIPAHEETQTVTTPESKPRADPGSSGFQQEAEATGGESVIVPILPSDISGEETVDQNQRNKKLEVIKSIVYGGLTETITSLGIVTSAASAETATEKIVALAVANLITGLIVIYNNLSSLKSNKKETKEEAETAEKDEYEEVLGDRENHLLHSMLAILSFLVFGLVPPLVYGFSFRQNDDKDMKLVAVAGASLICIVLLAIGKAYVRRAEKWSEYVKTVSYYVGIGFGASGLSYVAGKEFGELVEQLGWFKGNDSAPTLSVRGLDFGKHAWESF